MLGVGVLLHKTLLLNSLRPLPLDLLIGGQGGHLSLDDLPVVLDVPEVQFLQPLSHHDLEEGVLGERLRSVLHSKCLENL